MVNNSAKRLEMELLNGDRIVGMLKLAITEDDCHSLISFQRIFLIRRR